VQVGSPGGHLGLDDGVTPAAWHAVEIGNPGRSLGPDGDVALGKWLALDSACSQLVALPALLAAGRVRRRELR